MNPVTTDQLIALAAIFGFILLIYIVGEIFLRCRKPKGVLSTPVTDAGLAQFDDLSPGEAVIMAWSESGDNPRWHHKMQDDVRAQMPVLGRALDRMVEN